MRLAQKLLMGGGSLSPEFIGANSKWGSGSINVPAGTASGDLVILVEAATYQNSLTVPSGFNIARGPGDGIYLLYGVSGGETSYNVSSNIAQMTGIAVFRGVSWDAAAINKTPREWPSLSGFSASDVAVAVGAVAKGHGPAAAFIRDIDDPSGRRRRRQVRHLIRCKLKVVVDTVEQIAKACCKLAGKAPRWR